MQCYISNTVDEITTGNLTTLLGANPVQAPCYEEYIATYTPVIMEPVYVSTEDEVLPNGTTEVAVPATTTVVHQKAAGTCLWTGGEREGRVPMVVVVLSVIGALCGVL